MANNYDEKNPTTVRLTEVAQVIKDDLVPVFGLKNILSAGLVLFGDLSDTEQKQVVRRANQNETDVGAVKDEIAAQHADARSKRKQVKHSSSKSG